jgi:hypothetical protein
MRSTWILIALLLSPVTARAEAQEIWALLINNDVKEERHADNLRMAIRAVQDRLQLPDHDLLTVGPGDLRGPDHASNFPATGAGLASAVGALVARGQAPDLLLIYLTGHGRQTPSGDYRYPLGHNQLTGKALRALLDLVREPTRVWLIADTCYSGLALGAMEGLGSSSNMVSTTGATRTSCKRFAPMLWGRFEDPQIPLNAAIAEALEAHEIYRAEHPEWDPPIHRREPRTSPAADATNRLPFHAGDPHENVP